MAKLKILGSANAIPDEKHENTHMAVVGEGRLVLIDCVNNPIVRLRQAGLDVLKLTDLILTHYHPDHVSGVPSLLMNSWLLGRKEALNIYGLTYTLDRLERAMQDYDWQSWPGFYPVRFFRLKEEEMTLVMEDKEFRIYASPVCHMVPNIGLRVEFLSSGRVLAYSCDTEPCPAVVRLAANADVLIHEATGAGYGHTSPAQAGEIASQAGAKSLYLIHYNAGLNDYRPLLDEARTTFNGTVVLAEDFMEVAF